QRIVTNWQKERPKEYKRLIGFTKRVFDYAMHVELVDTNPMRNLYVPKLQSDKKREIEFFEKNELMDFLNHAKQYGEGDKWGVLFHFIAFTGCRKGEALALNWSDID